MIGDSRKTDFSQRRRERGEPRLFLLCGLCVSARNLGFLTLRILFLRSIYSSLTLSSSNANVPVLGPAHQTIPMMSLPSRSPKLANVSVSCFHSGPARKFCVSGRYPRRFEKTII